MVCIHVCLDIVYTIYREAAKVAEPDGKSGYVYMYVCTSIYLKDEGNSPFGSCVCVCRCVCACVCVNIFVEYTDI
jgi:hypothetical protein